MDKIKNKIEKLKNEFKSREKDNEKEFKKQYEKNFNLKNIELRSYQKDGVRWLLERNQLGIGCILADDMGLGKTAQTIGLIVNVLMNDDSKKVLIISPLSVVANWENELEKYTEGKINFLKYIGDKEERVELSRKFKKSLEKIQILLTTYDLIMKDDYLFQNVDWGLLVVDEGHRLKNSNTQLYKCLNEFKIEQRVLLTGTPIQNNLNELYSLICFIQPNLFKLRYIDEFVSKYKETQDTSNNNKAAKNELIDELTAILQPFVLRRVKSQVNINLPPRYECILYHDLTTLQKKLYKAILTKNLDVFTSNKKKLRLINVLMNLRKISLHPYLMPNIEPEPFELGEHIINTSGKFILLNNLLDHLYRNKHKVLLFSQFTCVLDIVQDYLTFKEYNYERLDGSIRGEERNIAVKNFNANQDVFIFLLSTKAGGVGLNLVSADTCIFMDNDFNPHNDLQAAARIHRIGQQKPIMIIRLICKSTVEEVIYKRAEYKLKLANNIIESGQLANNLDLVKSTSTTIINEICDILKYGLNNMFEKSKEDGDGDDKAMINEKIDFNKLLAPTSHDGHWQVSEKLKQLKKIDEKEEEEREAAIKTSQKAINEEISDGNMPKTIYEFEGKDYSKELFSDKDDEKLNELIENMKINAKKQEEAEEAALIGTKRKRVEIVESNESAEERKVRLEQAKLAKKQKLEEQKQHKLEKLKEKWQLNDYESLKLPVDDDIDDKIEKLIEENDELDDTEINNIDTKYLNYVTGDVTYLKFAKSNNAILINCVDDSGSWGRGGLFDALAKRSNEVPKYYKLSAEMNDIHLGDVHFIDIKNKDYSRTDKPISDYLALIIAHKRDKHGRLSAINMESVELAFKLIYLKAKKLNATIHMPRIGYNTPNFNWYGIERLIKKYFSNLRVPTYIYYFKRGSNTTANIARDEDEDEKMDIDNENRNENKNHHNEDDNDHDIEEEEFNQKNKILEENENKDDKLAQINEILPNLFTDVCFYFHNIKEDNNSKLIKFDQLKRHIIAYDGAIDDFLTNATTHVIIDDTSEKNLSELKNKLSKNGFDDKNILIVKYEWVETCLLRKKLIDLKKFLLK